MIKNNKLGIALSSFAILLPIAFGLVFWDRLPDTMTTHWNSAGDSDGWSTKAFAVFGLPLIMLAFQWICILITEKDPKNKNQSPKMQKLVLWICPALLWFASGVIYADAFGKEFNIEKNTLLIIGVMFVVLGNYMPKCKQNHTIGIKVKWALEDEENWNKTHRLGGKVWVVSGLFFMVCIFLPEKLIPYALIAILPVAALIPVIYSYLFYKRRIKNGEIAPSKIRKPFSGYNKAAAIVTAVIVLILAAALIILPVTGDIEIICRNETFEIQATYWNDLTVNYADIDKIELRNDVESGRRTNGFGTPRLLLGTFENGEFGTYTRYTYAKCKSCIVIKDGENVLVINAADALSTQLLYEELLAKNNLI